MHKLLRNGIKDTLESLRRTGLLNSKNELRDFLVDGGIHRLEHLKAFPLILDERVPLRERPQANAFLQLIHPIEMIFPLGVERLHQKHPLDMPQRLGPHRLFFLGVKAFKVFQNKGLDRLLAYFLKFFLTAAKSIMERCLQVIIQALNIKRHLFTAGKKILRHSAVDRIFNRLHDQAFHIRTLKNSAAQVIDHFPLAVHHIIILKKVLADLEVVPLDATLGVLDGLR